MRHASRATTALRLLNLFRVPQGCPAYALATLGYGAGIRSGFNGKQHVRAGKRPYARQSQRSVESQRRFIPKGFRPIAQRCPAHAGLRWVHDRNLIHNLNEVAATRDAANPATTALRLVEPTSRSPGLPRIRVGNPGLRAGIRSGFNGKQHVHA